MLEVAEILECSGLRLINTTVSNVEIWVPVCSTKLDHPATTRDVKISPAHYFFIGILSITHPIVLYAAIPNFHNSLGVVRRCIYEKNCSMLIFEVLYEIRPQCPIHKHIVVGLKITCFKVRCQKLPQDLVTTTQPVNSHYRSIIFLKWIDNMLKQVGQPFGFC